MSVYKNILQVKKQALQNARLKLLSAQNAKRQAQERVDMIDAQIAELCAMPVEHINHRIFIYENTQAMLEQRRAAQERVKLCQKEIVHYQHLYKLANIDYEKILYLYEEELLQKKKELERKQALELDEIATMLFANKDN